MLSGALAKRYARALFELSSESSALDQIEAEIRTISELIENNEEVRDFLYHPHVSLNDKKSVLDKLLSEGYSEISRRFLYLLIDRRRQNLLPLILKEYTRLADEVRQIVQAKVATAVELEASQMDRLKQVLSRLTGKQVRIVSEVRPELIGGVLVQVGDRVINGTIAHKLELMREQLRKTSDQPQEVGVK